MTGQDLLDDRLELAFASELDAFIATGREASAPVPALPASALCAALIDRSGRIVWQDIRFEGLLDPDQNDLDVMRLGLATRSILVGHGRNQQGAAVCLVLGRPEATKLWPVAIPEDALAKAGSGAVVAVAVHLGDQSDALISAGRAHGLTQFEARVAAALVRDGNLKVAARSCAIAYDTAREAVESARRKLGVARQSQLVARLTGLAAQTGDDGKDAERVLVDAFGLSPREAGLAIAMVRTGSRPAAAQHVGVSEALAKKQLLRIHEALGARTASDLSRIVLEVLAGALLAGAAERELAVGPGIAEPLLLVTRATGGMMALSDYGPATGKPLLVLHSGSASRLIPRSFVTRLQEQGWRPLGLDRPGFGLTDLRSDEDDPWVAAALDMVDLLDVLKLPTINLLCRGGVYAALAMARIAPERIGRVVALSPDVSTRHSHKRSGALGLLWKLGEADPDGYAAVTRWLASQTTPSRLASLQKVLLRRAPRDLAAVLNPQEHADMQRSVGLFAAGKVEGTIREHYEHSRGVEVGALGDASNWTVLIGGNDPLHAAPDVEAFWRPRLPGARVRVIKEGGHFLHLTDPDIVLEALQG